jgi:hypothetical protein
MVLFMEWFFSWEVTSVLAALLVGVAFAFLSLDDFSQAKLCFLLAAADAIGGTVMWGTKSGVSAGPRILIVFFCVGVFGVLAVESFRYVGRKEEAKKILPGSTPEISVSWPATANSLPAKSGQPANSIEKPAPLKPVHFKVSPDTNVTLPDLKVLNNQAAASSPIPEQPPTLIGLFMYEFPAMMKAASNFSVDGVSLEMKQQVYLDFDGKSKFVGFYVPGSDVILGEETYKMCMTLIEAVRPAVDELPKRLAIKGGTGEGGNTIEELVFTGRVLIYHQAPLSIVQKADIIRAYGTKHFDVQFRGMDYVAYQDGLWRKAKEGQ